MTVIAAVHQNGETWIGADSQRSFGHLKVGPVSKLIIGPSVILGISGAELTNNLVSNNREAVFVDTDPWQIGRRIKALVKEDGYQGRTETHEDVVPQYGADIIIARSDGVWHLSSGFTLSAMKEGDLWAVGSGGEIAMGAGYALATAHPRERVQMALQAACYWCRGCSAPFHVERLGAALKAAAE